MNAALVGSCPQVSVVIPAFNAGGFLHETLSSVMAQSGVEFEIVIVDDGSTDNTTEVAQEHGSPVTLIRIPHSGAQRARNVGLATSRAPFLKFLDADDVLLPGVLAMQLARAKALDERSIPYGPARAMDSHGTVGSVLPHTPPGPGLHALSHMLFFSPLISGPLHRRELIGEVGGFNESLPREHENDLHLRLVMAGVNFRYAADPIFAYRRHDKHLSLMGGGVTRFGSRWMLEYLMGVEERLVAHFSGAVPDDVRMHLAWYFWKCGRAILREGERSAALEYFDEARRIFPESPIYGRITYRVLCAILDPIRAEGTLEFWRTALVGTR